MIEKGQLLTLSNNKNYFVVNKIIINDTNYVYLISEEICDDIMFCIEKYDDDQITLTPIEDEEMNKFLIGEFNKLINVE